MNYFNYTMQFFLLMHMSTLLGVYNASQQYILPQTATIYGRFYLVKRIDRALIILEQDYVARMLTYVDVEPRLYQNPLVYTAACHMIAQKSVAPLFELWHACTSYQQLFDDQFEKEFTHLVYALCNEIRNGSHKFSSQARNLHEYLDCIDALIEQRVYKKSYVVPYVDTPTTDMIAQRYLVLKRLHKSIKLLHYLCDKNVPVHPSVSQKNGFHLDVEQLTHSRVREAIIRMYAEKNLSPMVALVEDVEQYRFIADDTFLQEMLMNLFVVYKGLLFRAHTQEESELIADQINQVLTIYENVNELPLDETLEAIDMVTDRLLALQYMQEEGFSLKKWFVPFVGGCACLAAAYAYMVWY